MTRYDMSGASFSSPATLGQVAAYVGDMAITVDGGCLSTQAYAPNCPADGAAIYVYQGKMWTKRANGSTNLLNGARNGMTTPVTVADDTETILLSYTVAGGEPAAGSIYLLHIWGDYTATGQAPSMVFTSYYGTIDSGTAVGTLQPVPLIGTETGCLWEITAMLQFYSTSSIAGGFRLNLSTDSTTGASTPYLAGPLSPITGVDTSEDTGFITTLTWSAKSNTLNATGGYGQRIA